MFKARGQPGVWFGYAELDGVTYKIDAKHVGKGVAKHFEGTIKRHLKADQQSLPLTPSERMTNAIRRDHAAEGQAIIDRYQVAVSPHVKPEEGFDFDDDLPENI